MIFYSHSNRLIQNLFFSGALLLVLCMPQQAQAQDAVTVVGGYGTIQESLTAAATAISSAVDESLEIKEYVLDGILYELANMALQEITQSTVEWISSGFEGSPAFITNLESFLIDSADQIAGELIYGSDLNALCSPFELDIRIALEIQQDYDRNLDRAVACTLSDVVDNVDGFLAGDFLAGGWEGWIELTTKPQNNIYGATAIAKDRLDRELARDREENIVESIWGNGFLSLKECESSGDNEICYTVTPGNVIEEQLNFDLQLGKQRLITADEINEIVSALFAYVGNQALSGTGGLLGLTQSSGDSGGNYFDDIGSDSDSQTGTETNSAQSFISGSLGTEQEYRNIQSSITNRADSILVRTNQYPSCTALSGIVSQVNSIKSQATNKVNASLANTTQLNDLQSRYDAAGPEERLAITEEFQSLKASGALNGQLSNTQAQFDADETMEELQRLDQEVTQAIPDCQEEEEDDTGPGNFGGGDAR